jgi:hypothetical protein
VDIQVEKITPATAGAWLQTMGRNRPASEQTVARYVAAMERGEWLVNGESIKFDTYGKLIDGQHRLTAVVRSEVPIESLVVRGLNGDAFETLDTGKNRKLPDLLALHGFVDVNNLAALTRLLYSYRYFGTVRSPAKVDVATSSHLLRAFVSDPSRKDELVEALRQGQNRKVTRSFFAVPLAAFTWFVTHRANPKEADRFFLELASSIGRENPASVLADRIAASRLESRKSGIVEAAAFCIKSWNAHVQGRQIKQLLYRARGAKAETFPEVEGLLRERI